VEFRHAAEKSHSAHPNLQLEAPEVLFRSNFLCSAITVVLTEPERLYFPSATGRGTVKQVGFGALQVRTSPAVSCTTNLKFAFC